MRRASVSAAAFLFSALLASSCTSEQPDTPRSASSGAKADGSSKGIDDDDDDSEDTDTGGGTPSHTGPLPPPVPSCSTNLEPELALLGVPGVSAGLIKNGKLVCTAVAGQANIEENRAVTPDTVFAWASVSKTVTAVTLMTLFDEGKLALDDGINARLPFQVTVPSCPGTPITFRQLLTHTSSIIEDEFAGVYPSLYVQGDSPIALGDFLRNYLVPGGTYYDESKSFAPGCPGTINSYSNVGAGMIGYLAERIAATPFDALADARVFKPLAMNESSFRLKSFDLSHLAMPYRGSSGAFTAAGHFGFPTYPDGLLRTSVPQLARFLLMFMNYGELDGARILTHATVDEMRKVQIPDLDDTQGLIWFYDDFPSRPHVLGHDGDDPGVSSNMYFDPADGSGVILVANGQWGDDAADTLMGKLFAEAATH